MHENKSRYSARGPFVLFLLAVAYFLTACSGGSQAPEKIRIAYLPIYAHLPLFVAVENGYFEDRGLDVELIRFESSPNMGTALVNDEVDVTASVATGTALSIESRDPGLFKAYAVFGGNSEEYLSSLVAMPDSGLERVEDLEGKTVGIFPGPEAQTFFGLLFEQHGLNPDEDINIVELAPGLHVQALASGQVDALATYEPMATQAVVDHGAVKFLPAAIEAEVADPWYGGLWLIRSAFLEEYPGTVEEVISAVYQALDHIKEDPDGAKQALSEYTGIEPDIAVQATNSPVLPLPEVDVEDLQRYADIIYDAGLISQSIDVQTVLIGDEFLPDSN